MTAAERIIVPLDVPTLADAISLLEQLPQVNFWKVGLELFVSSGPAILQVLRERQKRIFLDLKFHDIPNTVAKACRGAAVYEVDFLSLHAAAGRAALTAAAAATQGTSTKLLAISVLTSLSARELALDLKISLELQDYALQMALLAQDCGLAGAVCSPQEIAALRRVCGNNLLLVCPGIRPTWSDPGDQRRTTPPAQALQAGADYLVIGRPITAASHPAQAWERICEEITAA
ncbi:MAG: orotidine-5'-phosphate decarboxylase [Chloroflexaceae bacterium]|nr:orotidine-5'-phosphate decarboxylase [Chloroflexaceae bacterium]